jgi:predicted RND superfamily exporter protein/outer membrane lipoprotein-sorting protein
LAVVLGILLLVLPALFLPSLVTDTRPNAFLSEDNPALLYREKVKEQFGLSDPLIIAIRDEGEYGIYNPATLATLLWLTDEIFDLPNVNAESSVSLATEKNIVGTADGLEIQPFFDPLPESEEEIEALRAALADFPLYLGNLVSEDGQIALIVAELEDELQVETTYRTIMELVARAPVAEGVSIHVAGEGAIAGFLAGYIDADAKRLNPIAWLIILAVIYLAFRRFSPLMLANVIIAASVLISLGVMAAGNVAFFMITSALPVILIGISVADTIHIYSYYFELQARHPERDIRALVVETMQAMWRPITLTTVTTMAGFLGLYFAAQMPPFRYFGLFAALGVFGAWLYSMVLLPAAIVWTKPRASAQYVKNFVKQDTDAFGQFVAILGYFNLRFARWVIAGFLLISLAGLYAASQLLVDEDPITIFDPSEPIYIADKLINEHMQGANALDIVIETPEEEGLFIPENLRKMEALQAYAETLPHVGGSISIVDYLKQMNRVLNNGAPESYSLPESKEMVAQYFLLYSLSSDPADFEEEVDYEYQTANIRVNINSGSYQDFKPVVDALAAYIDREFNDPGISASLSGRVNLNYHWIGNLGRSHYSGLVISLLLVWAMAAMLFGSLRAGVYALIPVAGSVLLVYTAMVLGGLRLGVGTSMFAAVAIGLGVDFSIHTLERLRELHGRSTDNGYIFNAFYQTTGRALLFNLLAIACGFGVLISSEVSSLNNFGGILVVAVCTSFVASLTLLPALVYLGKPAFILPPDERSLHWQKRIRLGLLILLLLVPVVLLVPVRASAAEALSADEIVARVNAVDDGVFLTRRLDMLMTDRRGKTRQRKTINYRKYFGEDKRTVLFYTHPANIRDTGFLIWDYAAAGKDDDQWLYLPAMRKVRRVSAADRGDYFLGTDFTFEDIKLDGKFEPRDYVFSYVGEEKIGTTDTVVVEAVPISDEVKKELGYSRNRSWVDASNWILKKVEFWDVKGRPLKTLLVDDVRKVDGIWTRHRLSMTNHRTRHSTQFIFSEVDYVTPVPDNRFSKRSLERGH